MNSGIPQGQIPPHPPSRPPATQPKSTSVPRPVSSATSGSGTFVNQKVTENSSRVHSALKQTYTGATQGDFMSFLQALEGSDTPESSPQKIEKAQCALQEFKTVQALVNNPLDINNDEKLSNMVDHSLKGIVAIIELLQEVRLVNQTHRSVLSKAKIAWLDYVALQKKQGC